jgi:hypothetical protein
MSSTDSDHPRGENLPVRKIEISRLVPRIARILSDFFIFGASFLLTGSWYQLEPFNSDIRAVGAEVLQVRRFDLISWADAPHLIDFRTVQVAPV